MSKGFWSNLFSAPRDRFSLDEMHRLHSVLLRNQVISDTNRGTVVEALRSISELVIWGDQQDTAIVEYFLTENIIGHFHQILLERTNRRGNVAIQVLQTLSILLQNVRNQQTIYYLFSNDHINNIVTLRFDFDDDELLGYYVNLLKTISLRLNEATVQFFFHSKTSFDIDSSNNTASPSPNNNTATFQPAKREEKTKSEFPLYTEAIKFINHKDGMVRAAVKTLMLNVFTLKSVPLQRFLYQPPACDVFLQIARYTSDRCQHLDRILSSREVPPPQAVAAVESCLSEIEDVLSYCNDVIAVGVPELSRQMLGQLWKWVVGPIMFWPLTCSSANDMMNTGGGKEKKEGIESQGIVGPLCSLFVMERFLYAMTHPNRGLLSVIACSLLGGDSIKEEAIEMFIEEIESSRTKTSMPESNDIISNSSSSSPCFVSPPKTVFDKETILHGVGDHYGSTACRTWMLQSLRGVYGAQMASASIRVVAALLSHRSLPEHSLEYIGLLPRRIKKQRRLINALTQDSESSLLLVERNDTTNNTNTNTNHDDDGNQNDSDEEDSTLKNLHRYSSRKKEPIVDTISPSKPSSLEILTLHHHGDSYFKENISALLQGLNLDSMSPTSMHLCGWILYTLLVVGGCSALDTTAKATPPTSTTIISTTSTSTDGIDDALCEEWRAQLDSIVHHRQSRLLQHLSPSPSPPVGNTIAPSFLAVDMNDWIDAFPPLITYYWFKTKKEIVRKNCIGHIVIAAHSWMNGVVLQELQWQIESRRNNDGNGTVVVDDANIPSATSQKNESTAALSAQIACASIHSLVIALHIRSVVLHGDIDEVPPIDVVHMDAVLKNEVHEGDVLSLHSSKSTDSTDSTNSIWKCSVAFSKGIERHVLLKLHNTPPPILLSKDSALKANSHADTATPSTFFSFAQSPCVVIVDPGDSQYHGTALSSAPLFSTHARLDEKHPEWLHIRVRPPLSSLLQIIAKSPVGTDLVALEKHLQNGHWVLAFENREAARRAKDGIVECEGRSGEIYRNALHALLSSS